MLKRNDDGDTSPMNVWRSLLATAVMIAGMEAAMAQATCEDVRTDLTGQNLFGGHTMKQLSEDAQAGNCDAASALTRRSRNAQGFIVTHCPNDADLQSTATEDLRLGQRILRLPACQE